MARRESFSRLADFYPQPFDKYGKGYTMLLGVGAAITPTVQIVLLSCGVWLVVVYCLALYFGLRTGWRMLMGRT